MSALKDTLQADLKTAMKGRDTVTTATLRMALTAVRNEEVAGKSSRELADDDVLKVLARELKRRRESAEAYDDAHRPELADREREEAAVLERYLPAAMSDEDLTQVVARVIAEVGASGTADMGKVMKPAQAAVAGTADGKRLSTEVRRQLSA
ncbi:hypothetical protein CLV47_103133 [Antricoccus suffuscus]|uniref:GatB/YqeY domain-containing protein n=1 Tax=Antricoccus suffuscus TaxID=1629062 RepID=A0A2T1A3B1_9ACTN|nr:GatB/YqeY domain-containing protein [Antricoccus suffuscus]PRZ43076.1 hypothetical protein CLV47_103133 [Antricoccus suffuscus]